MFLLRLTQSQADSCCYFLRLGCSVPANAFIPRWHLTFCFGGNGFTLLTQACSLIDSFKVADSGSFLAVLLPSELSPITQLLCYCDADVKISCTTVRIFVVQALNMGLPCSWL